MNKRRLGTLVPKTATETDVATAGRPDVLVTAYTETPMTIRLAGVLGFAAFMLALAANAADIRLRCEMKAGGISYYTITDKTVRVDQPSGDTLTLPVEETPTQFRFPTQDGPIIVNRVTGELYLSQDVGASGTCALEPTKF